MRIIYVVIVGFILLFFASCNKSETSSKKPLVNYKVNGIAVSIDDFFGANPISPLSMFLLPATSGNTMYLQLNQMMATSLVFLSLQLTFPLVPTQHQ